MAVEKAGQHGGTYFPETDELGYKFDYPRVHITGKVTSDTPLETTAQDFAGAINELFTDITGGGDAGWTMPDDWITLPSTLDANKIYMVVDTHYTSTISIQVYYYYKLEQPTSEPTVIGIDWGDGNTSQLTVETNYTPLENASIWTFSHTYTAGTGKTISDGTEQFLITISEPAGINNFWIGTASGNSNTKLSILEIGLGDNCINGGFYGTASFMSSTAYAARLRVAHLTNTRQFTDNLFNRSYALSKFICDCDITNIPNYAFYECYGGAAKNLDLSKVVSVGQYAFGYLPTAAVLNMPALESLANGALARMTNLRELNAPNLTSIGDYAFYADYNLTKVVYASGCTIGSGAFDDCVNYIQ